MGFVEPVHPNLSPDPVIDFVLQVLCHACTDAWCFARREPLEITHCSDEFLKLFSVDEQVPDESGQPIPLSDDRFAQGCHNLGLPGTWLARQLSVTPSKQRTAVTDSEFDSFVATRHMLNDSSGEVFGCLLLFRHQGGTGTMQLAWRRARDARRDLAVLTSREAEILRLVSTGLTNKAVARRAGITEKTVEKHRANIMRKMNLTSTADLLRRVTEASLLDCELTGAT